jgi:hypothetical protein
VGPEAAPTFVKNSMGLQFAVKDEDYCLIGSEGVNKVSPVGALNKEQTKTK